MRLSRLKCNLLEQFFQSGSLIVIVFGWWNSGREILFHDKSDSIDILTGM